MSANWRDEYHQRVIDKEKHRVLSAILINLIRLEYRHEDRILRRRACTQRWKVQHRERWLEVQRAAGRRHYAKLKARREAAR